MRWFRKSKRKAGWIAISLAPDGLRAAHIIRSVGKPVVDRVAHIPLDGIPIEVALEKLARELHLLQYQCSTLLGSGEYQLLSLEAPNVPPEELKVAVRWKLKDMLDYHVDDATIDVLDVPVDSSAPVRNHTMYAVAARNQTIQQRQTLFMDAGIPLTVIDVPEMAQRNFSVLLESEGRGLAFLAFDDTGGLLTVSYNGELYLARRIELPLAQIVQADDEQRAACFDRIALELQRSLDHFERQFHFIAVSGIVLGPCGAVSGHLRDYLSEHLYVPVRMLELEKILDTTRVPQLTHPEEQQRYFLTLGAALRHEETVP